MELPNEKNPRRKLIRAEFHNYSGGLYFVTICTAEKMHYFGEIQNNNMVFTAIGKYCCKELEQICFHYPYAKVIQYVVMPNHLHAIIEIEPDRRTHEPCVPTIRTLLSVVIGGFKRAVTLYARRNDIDFAWQSRYHDHIIRNFNDGNNISRYIDTNIEHWASDCYY